MVGNSVLETQDSADLPQSTFVSATPIPNWVFSACQFPKIPFAQVRYFGHGNNLSVWLGVLGLESTFYYSTPEVDL